jgi:hypothetical protein
MVTRMKSMIKTQHTVTDKVTRMKSVIKKQAGRVNGHGYGHEDKSSHV